MKYTIEDKKYKFKSFFDTESGFYMRTGVLDENGQDTNVDPFMASYKAQNGQMLWHLRSSAS